MSYLWIQEFLNIGIQVENQGKQQKLIILRHNYLRPFKTGTVYVQLVSPFHQACDIFLGPYIIKYICDAPIYHIELSMLRFLIKKGQHKAMWYNKIGPCA